MVGGSHALYPQSCVSTEVQYGVFICLDVRTCTSRPLPLSNGEIFIQNAVQQRYTMFNVKDCQSKNWYREYQRASKELKAFKAVFWNGNVML